MHHVIGTAGHIDHGKTALIRALTGQDTDRLKEEKERGISIDLGFAYLDLPDQTRAGIIDVPGHERFIRNMLAGAHGIDLVLMVVAADDGVMPQTREHLDIVDLLGVTHGIVVLTKIDRTDAARIAEVRRQIDTLLAGTVLADAPRVSVSSRTGEGIDLLRKQIAVELSNCRQRDTAGLFRMPVDRSFVLAGRGAVATGTVISGSVTTGDQVRVLPTGTTARVRALHVHGEDRSSAQAGQRVALNLVGVEQDVLPRGSVICDATLERLTTQFDAWVDVRSSYGRAVKSHETVRLHMGSAERLARIVWLGSTALDAGAGCLAQICLKLPAHILQDDRFVLRTANAQQTLGGGIVLNPFSSNKLRRDTEYRPALERARTEGPASRIQLLLECGPEPIRTTQDFIQATGLPASEIERLLKETTARPIGGGASPEAWMSDARWDSLRRNILQTLERFHQTSPLSEGMEMERVRTQLAAAIPAGLFRTCIEALCTTGELARSGSLIHLPQHQVRLKNEESAIAEKVVRKLTDAGLMPPSLRELATELAMNTKELLPLVQQLSRSGRIHKVSEELYFSDAAVVKSRETVREHLRDKGQITVAELRDRLGLSRKYSIALLEYFDRIGFTMRVGDARKLRGKG